MIHVGNTMVSSTRVTICVYPRIGLDWIGLGRACLVITSTEQLELVSIRSEAFSGDYGRLDYPSGSNF